MSYLPQLGAFLLPLAALLAPTVAQDTYTSSKSETPKDNNANCSCYVVSSGANSDTPEYFQYYRFYDFRNLTGALETVPLINNTQNTTLAPTWQPKIFNGDDWNADWGVQNWSTPASADFPVPMSNSYANIFVGQENRDTFLSLRTSRLDDHQTAGEIENQQKNLMHVSMRMYGRVTGGKGAVAGFFTFYDDNNESDIEILTRDPKDQTRYTNQPSVDKQGNEITAASTGPTNLPAWDEWQTHRIDWLPKHSYWYLNNKQVAANTYSVPRKPSFLVLNMWGNGGEWSGNMTVGEQAEFHIQWIEMTFNTSGPYTGDKGAKGGDKRSLVELDNREVKGCQNVCKIDGVQQIGTPEIAHEWDGGEDDEGGLSAGAKAGIAIGVILGVALLAAVAWFFWRKKKGPAPNKKDGYEMQT
ncbi:concanavalin A-like lectin/glucanase [Ophiobolus disseminans]|uniref:Concanavalin A-like lectin/glucanase n=1 Tax=Ophiobolus disseminans TaxID=1469910 RepID=A0A6A7AJG4_9PLEO|nr:concanavalin A-like lectin/glucanase [Ophiobolus disseminans]